jgi:BirA family biotin operon repressor/biotin-[acetyl-CoA-carboxylase] ligase
MQRGWRDWQPTLDALCARSGTFTRAIVLEETLSTQDASETRDAPPGTFVTAWRQTSGRGRFGRHWSDTGDLGIATTFVIDAQPSERLAIVGAIAAAEAAESTLGSAVGIKWPNDVVVDGKKLAGVLIERSGARVLIGIGLNVSQESFGAELASRATSLAMLGARIDRLDVLCALVLALERALAAGDDALVAQFHARDALRGTRALFSTPSGPIEGEVLSVDPMRGLRVRSEGREHFLPAQSTSVAEWGRVLKAQQSGGRYPA